jgi:hypothetical protein
MQNDRTMTIYFNDGTKMAFEFAEQAPNAAAKQIKLTDFMASSHMVVEAEGSLLLFPVANIKYIALNAMWASGTKFPGLPKHTITGARIRG